MSTRSMNLRESTSLLTINNWVLACLMSGPHMSRSRRVVLAKRSQDLILELSITILQCRALSMCLSPLKEGLIDWAAAFPPYNFSALPLRLLNSTVQILLVTPLTIDCAVETGTSTIRTRRKRS